MASRNGLQVGCDGDDFLGNAGSLMSSPTVPRVGVDGVDRDLDLVHQLLISSMETWLLLMTV